MVEANWAQCTTQFITVLANPEVQARLEGKAPKKVIVLPKRIVSIVV